jgi:hypothetical protein
MPTKEAKAAAPTVGSNYPVIRTKPIVDAAAEYHLLKLDEKRRRWMARLLPSLASASSR